MKQQVIKKVNFTDEEVRDILTKAAIKSLGRIKERPQSTRLEFESGPICVDTEVTIEFPAS